VHGEGCKFRIRTEFSEIGKDLEPGHIGQRDVEEKKVGMKGFGGVEKRPAAGKLAYNLVLTVFLEQSLYSFPDGVMIIEKYDPKPLCHLNPRLLTYTTNIPATVLSIL